MARFLKKSDKEKLDKFYAEAYGTKHILKNSIHHNWQFNINPFNQSNNPTIVLTETNDEISSHLGFIPIELLVQQSVKKAMWHVSFFTLEKYRGQKLGTKLVEFTSNLTDFTMVLSGSDGTKQVYFNINGHDLGDLNRHIAILDKKNLEYYLNHLLPKKEADIHVDDHLQFIRVEKISDDYFEFWKKVSSRYPITINRTPDYLSWRFFNHPLINYYVMELRNKGSLVGFCVLRFEDNNPELKAARIVDLIIFPEYEYEMLQHILNYCNKKVDFVDFFCTGNHYKSALEKSNFFNNLIEDFPIPTVFNPIDMNRRSQINFFYKCNIEPIVSLDLKNIDNWYFVKADSDQDRAN